MTFDVVLRNAKIVDGTGNPWYYGDVAMSSGRVALVGRVPRGTGGEEFDVGGRVVAPGFIDPHTHSDFVIFRDPLMPYKLAQGVTTQVMGQCGMSAAPASTKYVRELGMYSGFIMAGTDVDWKWRSFASWLDEAALLPLGGNVVPCVGHGTIRIAVMGFEDRYASAEEMSQMKELVREAMEAGCFGLTSGLIYPPGVYAPEDEIPELCSVFSGSGIVYLSHMRNESNDLVKSTAETIGIARRANVPVQISHHKALGKANWGTVKETLKMVDEARAEGLDITLDQYPYDRCSTSIRAILPPWVQEGGVGGIQKRLEDPEIRGKVRKEIEDSICLENPCEWESMLRHSGGPGGALVSYCPKTPQWEGKTLRQVGEIWGKSAVDAAFDIITANDGNDIACYDAISEEDVEVVMRHPAMMVGSDSIPAAEGAKTHPRSYGTQARILSRYVREKGVLTLEKAVQKMSAFPAARFGLQSKGILREGMDADVIVFDEKNVRERATFEEPTLWAEGMDAVYVAGVKVWDSGKPTGAVAGRVLLKNRR
jgi:N-acyl-D-amino-acid deacylase